MGKDCLPSHLRDAKHLDWPIGFRWVPRAWTAFCFGNKAPKMLLGTQEEMRQSMKYDFEHAVGPAPIGEPGTWQISWPPYFAFSTKRSKDGKFAHFRIGFRWDDVDGYYNLSIAKRKYTGSRIEDTST